MTNTDAGALLKLTEGQRETLARLANAKAADHGAEHPDNYRKAFARPVDAGARENVTAAQEAKEPSAWCQPMDCGKHTPRKFYLYFDDPDHGNMVFDNEVEARAAFERKSTAWNCYLFGALPLSSAEPKSPVDIGAYIDDNGDDGR